MIKLVGHFSFGRLWGLLVKETIQFTRDRSTFAIIIIIPIFQLTLFGLAINMNPKHLPTALINFDNGPFSRTLIQGMENTDYFRFQYYPKSEVESVHLIRTNQALFSLTIPPDFSRKFVRGEHPQALLEVDGTDPVSVAYAVSASNNLMKSVFNYQLTGPLSRLKATSGPATLNVHTKYNPSGITQYNIIPGLLGTILTLTFVMVASMALTRERERGTMETLLSTPIMPIEVIIGKSLPFIVVGYLQIIIVVFLAVAFFKVPLVGSVVLLFGLSLPFVLASLFVGIMISTVSKTQLEANQLSVFFFLPSLLLSGFAFPFKGMPLWAQWIGNVLPMTHFINIVRGIMLKGSGLSDLWIDLWPLLLFMFAMLFISLYKYRQTLD